MHHEPINSIRAEFIEKIGLIAQAEGMPRIAGRVFGLLVFDGQAISFADLAATLQVSRGSISSSVRLLEERGLIKRTAKPGERQDYFQLADNPYATMIDRVTRSLSRAKGEISATIAKLPTTSTDVCDRLCAYADFYGTMAATLQDAFEAPDSDQDA